MNIKQQIFFDSYIAKPLAFALNFLVRILGKILSINHELNNKTFQTICLCKFKGMGSIIQATPMIKAIKKAHPKSEIIFISTKSNRSILEKIDLIDTIITIDDSNFISFITSNIKSLFFLIRKRPEVYFDLEIYSDYSTLFTLFSLSINRIGFYLRSSSFRMGIYTHMMFFNPRTPISNVYLQMSQLIGCNTSDTQLYSLVQVKKPDISKNTDPNYIIINPNSSDLRLERRWSSENFIQLIEKILTHFPTFNIILIGAKGDEQIYSQEIADKIKNDRLINTAGKTSIEELIDLIDNSTLMITNDTGPMHIAFSVNTNVICLFGPCSPDQYGVSNSSQIIYKSTYCSPCVHDFHIAPCNGDNVCMKLITVKEVFEKVCFSLEKKPIKEDQQKINFIYKEGANIFGRINR